MPNKTTPPPVIEIKHWLSGAVLFSGEFDNVLTAVKAAAASGADLQGAYLQGADLQGACLQRACLQRAYLRGAKQIISFGPCPGSGRIGYIVAQNDKEPLIQLGCFWGTLEQATERIHAAYPDARGEAYIGIIKAALAVLELSRVAS